MSDIVKRLKDRAFERMTSARVEELEADVRKEWLIGYDEAHTEIEKKGHYVTNEQINAAWALIDKYKDDFYIVAALAELGIVRCKGCLGSVVDDPVHKRSSCPDCNGHGWTHD